MKGVRFTKKRAAQAVSDAINDAIGYPIDPSNPYRTISYADIGALEDGAYALPVDATLEGLIPALKGRGKIPASVVIEIIEQKTVP